AKIVSDLIAGLRYSPHPRLGVELAFARMAALDRVVTLSQLMGQEPPLVATPPPSPTAPPAAAHEEPKKKSPELSPERTGPEAPAASDEPDAPLEPTESAERTDSAEPAEPPEPEERNLFEVTAPPPDPQDDRPAPAPITLSEAPARWPDLV